ncbi:hypothetical protein PROPEN_04403 [Proteus penneri ATCC 35198]|nr:hypothetical protein PROPEN_04403 [Proteus penneri ATCC 35198]
MRQNSATKNNLLMDHILKLLMDRPQEPAGQNPCFCSILKEQNLMQQILMAQILMRQVLTRQILLVEKALSLLIGIVFFYIQLINIACVAIAFSTLFAG